MNIEYNFSNQSQLISATSNESLSIMPTDLAKKLLENYAMNMANKNHNQLIHMHIDSLENCTTLEEAIGVSMSWIAERNLIKDISLGNLHKYQIAINSQEPEPVHNSH